MSMTIAIIMTHLKVKPDKKNNLYLKQISFNNLQEKENLILNLLKSLNPMLIH